MKSNRLTCLLAAAAALLLFASSRAADDNTSSIKFSDPSKPGTLKVNMSRGELRVQGADTTDVTVKSELKAASRTPRKDGLRVLGGGSGFGLSEKDNVVTLDASMDGMFHGGGSDFNVTVPRGTMIIVSNWFGGDVRCSGIAGDIEVNSMHGEIRLEDVSGGVVASTMNGEIRASVRELHDGHPLSFTSMNGAVTIRVAPDAKANVRLRTQNGQILTDFEETALVTKSEYTGKTATWNKGRTVMGPEFQSAIREAAQAGAIAVKEAMAAVKDGIDSAQDQIDKSEADQARRAADQARREADQARRQAEREADRARRDAARVTPAAPPAPAVPATPADGAKPSPAPKAVKVPIPPITGGNLVSGALNGGGPEITVATMNGEVKLLKLEAKK